MLYTDHRWVTAITKNEETGEVSVDLKTLDRLVPKIGASSHIKPPGLGGRVIELTRARLSRLAELNDTFVRVFVRQPRMMRLMLASLDNQVWRIVADGLALPAGSVSLPVALCRNLEELQQTEAFRSLHLEQQYLINQFSPYSDFELDGNANQLVGRLVAWDWHECNTIDGRFKVTHVDGRPVPFNLMSEIPVVFDNLLRINTEPERTFGLVDQHGRALVH